MHIRLTSVVVVAALTVAAIARAGVLPADLAAAEQRLAVRFASRGIAYPPRRVALIALKREARLELWGDPGDGWRFVRSYLIRASSGHLGPKLRQGDHQVPEGVYRVASLNPASAYHLSLRLDYPSEVDRAHASRDGRTRLGGDIMIHGDVVSDGCLPVGDAAIEELFAVAERVGVADVPVIVAPYDFRRADAPDAGDPAWLPELYATIATALEPFALPPDETPAAPTQVREGIPACAPYGVTDCARQCVDGDVASCSRAGLLYEGELGAPADPSRAWGFLRFACSAGDAFGCAELARLYVVDDGPHRDAARAAGLARLACDGGDGHGCAYLARLCAERIVYEAPGTPDMCSAERVRSLREAAVAYLRRDCRGWNAHDCSMLATIYYPGNPPAALPFASGACDGGDPGGCYVLARLAEERGDAPGAAVLYASACRQGYPEACERRSAEAPRAIPVARPLRGSRLSALLRRFFAATGTTTASR